MKVSELRPCDNCGQKIFPVFYVLRFSLAFIHADAVNEFFGMHQFFQGRASNALVENFAPASCDAVTVAMDKDKDATTELFICQNCFVSGPLDLAMLMERRASQLENKT